MRTRPLFGLLLSFSLTLLWLIAPTVAAQDAPSIDFIEVSARADFPETIDFTLVATTNVDIVEVQLFWRAIGSSAFTLAEPEFTGDETIRAGYQANMSVRYLPPGLDIEYFWRVTDFNGNVHESEPATIFYIDERFEWQSIDGGLLSVWWYDGSEDYARDILSAANSTLIQLDEQYGLQAVETIRIIVYANGRDFGNAMPPNSADWIGGVAYSALNHIVAQIAPGGGAARETSRMIPHEVSHIVVHQASRNPYNSPPPWLDEGLATYVQVTGDERLSPILDRAVRDGRLIPLGALKSSFPLDPDQALLSYAESVSVVAYLVETYGRARVGELISVYREEVSHDRAVESVLGITIDELDSQWKQSLGYQGDRPPDSEGAGVSVSALLGGGTVILLAAAVAVGTVIVALWKTRTYGENDGEDLPDGGAEQQAEVPQP
ncbi:MAG: hypothetical protein H0V47_04730 [Chloroflexia bacterium]|nr:hypothetical protein [Chloroflexia bacterium]